MVVELGEAALRAWREEALFFSQASSGRQEHSLGGRRTHIPKHITFNDRARVSPSPAVEGLNEVLLGAP